MSFLIRIKPGAIRGWREEGILASVIGAQAALEGGWGTSKLAKPPYNNHFGIKASADWTGKVINMPTLEFINGAQVSVNADFRWYDSEDESLLDHARFFTNTPWRTENYKAVVGETDYKKAAWALQNAPAPYATDPGYAQKLINIIEQNNLQAWDVEAMSETAADTVATPVVQTARSKMVGAELTSAGQEYVKNLPVTVIGDSLGVGTRSHLQLLIATANFDVLGSRQLTHETTSLDATKTLQSMKNAGTLKEYVVVIIGTNRGVTEQEINNFVAIAGAERKIIFVDTASEVAHANAVSVFYADAAKRLSNVFYVNWHLHATPKLAEYYSKDGANGEYIHMTSTGYKKHAEFIAQALYEVATGDFTERTAVTPKVDYYNIETLELKPDGIVTYDAWKVNTDGTSTKYKATRQTEIKGLFSPYGDNSIYNAEANQQQGFGGSVNNSNWLEARYTNTEETDMFKLLHEASVELIDRSTPDVQYTVSLMEMPDTISIGDTGIFVDHDFQPPLYIRARIISISVSRTNPRLNRVILGNVVELHPQKKDQLMTMRDELAVTREDLRNEWINSEQVVAEIITTNGPVLGDKFAETDLMARVLKSGVNITDQFDSFKWQRISGDEGSDAAFNQLMESTTQSSVLPVVAKDIIGNQSQFVARAYNAKDELVHTTEIVLKRVDTALWVDTDTPPEDAKDGATWTKPDGTQWVKKDGVWQERVDQETISAVRLEVEGAMTEAEQAKANAITARNEAVAEAERLVLEQNQVWQGVMAGYDEQVGFIETGVSEAKAKADRALIDVGVSTDLATTAKSLADQAKASAAQAIIDASNAMSDVSILSPKVTNAVNNATSAVGTAVEAYNNAQSALSKTGELEGTTNTLVTNVDDLAGEVSLKATQTSVNLLSGTVENHTADITANATEIAKRLTSTQVDSLVDGKGFSTVNYVDTHVSTTASGIRADMTKVEGKIDGLQVGGTNLWDESNYASRVSGSVIQLTNFNGHTQTATFDSEVPSGLSGLSEKRISTANVGGGYHDKSSIWLDAGKYTISYWAKGTQTTHNGYFVCLNDPNNFYIMTPEVAIMTYWKRYTHIVNIPTANYYKRRSIIYKASTTWISHFKLEKGTVATDWSPAPEDTLMQNDFNVFKASYEATAESLTSRLTAIDKTGGRLATAESNISQNATALTQRFTKTEVNNLLSSKADTSALTGLATQTWTNTQISTSASGITAEISRVESSIPSLNGYATQTWSNTQINAKAGEVTQLITDVKTNPTGTITGYNSLKNNVDSMVQAIGTDGGKIAQMVLTNSTYQTTISDLELKTRMGLGRQLRDDPTFEKGTNGIGVYNNSNNGSVAITREHVPDSTQPTDNFWRLRIAHTGVAAPGYGGVVALTNSRVGAEFIIRFTALVPSGREVYHANISIGTGGVINWLTPRSGTGKWEEYAYHVKSGSTGTFSNFGHTYLMGGAIPTPTNPLYWYIAKFEVIDISASQQSQITQLADSWALTLKSGNDIKTSINASTNSIRLASKFIHLSGTSLIDNATIKSAMIDTLNANKVVGNTADFNTIRTGVLSANVVTSTHISADNALIDKLFATSALIDRLTSKTAFISQLKAIDLVADKASFLQAGWQALNSRVTIDGSRIKLSNTVGDFAEINNIPEFRSQDVSGTATIMGKGRNHYYSGNVPRFYLGSNLEGLAQHGVHIAKGQTWGIYRYSDSYGGTPAQYHTVKAGESWRSLTDLYYTTSTSVYVIGDLNGRNPANDWLQIGEVILVKAAILGNSSGVERIWTMGTATNGTTRVYSHVYHVFEAGTSLSSDRRIKHDIEESQVNALNHINSLAFKRYRMNRDNNLIELGLIAQDSGILRVQDDETEGIDLQGSIMLALKGTQELYAIVKTQAEEIKQLKELINS